MIKIAVRGRIPIQNGGIAKEKQVVEAETVTFHGDRNAILSGIDTYSLPDWMREADNILIKDKLDHMYVDTSKVDVDVYCRVEGTERDS